METKIYIIPLSKKLREELQYRLDISLEDKSFIEDNEDIDHLRSLRVKLYTTEKTVSITEEESKWLKLYSQEFDGHEVYKNVQKDLKRIDIALGLAEEVTQDELKDRCVYKGGRSVWGKPDFRLDGKMYNYQ